MSSHLFDPTIPKRGCLKPMMVMEINTYDQYHTKNTLDLSKQQIIDIIILHKETLISLLDPFIHNIINQIVNKVYVFNKRYLYIS